MKIKEEKGDTKTFFVEGKFRQDLTEGLGTGMGRSTYFEVYELPITDKNPYGGYMLTTGPNYYGKNKSMVLAIELGTCKEDWLLNKWRGFLCEIADM
jgi:hypothetical protein